MTETPNGPRTFLFLPWLQAHLIHLAILGGFWATSYLVLLFLLGMQKSDALGYATVATIVASFFIRSAVPQPTEKSKPSTLKQPSTMDNPREIIETVVFVVVLVLMLKSFVAEAFVIPTGSMAETLYGYQKMVTCPQCGVEFPVNCSSEVDPSDGHPPMAVNGCICPNCRLDIKLYPTRMAGPMPAEPGAVRDPGWRSGDRVLVGKFVYDLPEKHPDRLDVVVFKFPGDREFPHTGPVKKHVPINYIKRLIGLPGETVAVHRGKIWLLGADRGLTYKQPEGPDAEKTQSWRYRNMHHDDTQAVERFNRGEFEILRKPPTQLLAMRRLVYDADHPARDLKGPEFQRWLSQTENGWSPIDKQSTSFRHEGTSQDISWLRYRHVLRPGNDRGPVVGPQLITDFMGYNTWAGGGGHFPPRENWASDLMVECEAVFDKLEGSFAMELSRGEDRYQALFDLNQGTCSLIQTGKNQEAKTLATEKVSLGSGKAHLLRFANMDDRLCVWVDEKLPFGDGLPYGPVRNLVPTRENDLERPVRLGSKNVRVAVSKLKLFRDTYYTTNRGDRPSDADVSFNPGDSSTFSAWQDAPVSTYYVQPGHYLCLGDNSPESSDGRSWGLVPQRLLLGKAMLVYYPFSRAGRIR